MTLDDLIPRKLEPVAILFVYTVAAALVLGATINPLKLGPAILAPLSWAGAAAMTALPWTTSSRMRAIASGLVAAAILARIAALLFAQLWTGATIYGAVFWAVVLILSRDQDHAFRQKLTEGPSE